MTRVRAALAISAAMLALATGCMVPGHPSPERPDLGSFDVGGYSREPLREPADDKEQYGRVMESVRLGEVVADPVEVDSTLTFPVTGYTAVPLPTAAKAGAFLAAPVRAVLEKRAMLAGFAVGRTDMEVERTPVIGTARLLTIMVLRFPDPTAAQRAAEEIDAVDAAVSPENVTVGISEYPAAHGHWRPNVPTVAVSLAHESFVVTLLVGHASPDLGTLTTLARKAFDAQLPRLRDFVATPRDQLATLPLDRDGMLGRMVPKAPGRWPFPAVVVGTTQENAGWDTVIQPSGAVYGPRATQLFRGATKPNLPERIAFNGLEALMRYPDATAARQAFVKTKQGNEKSGRRSVAGPVGVPDIICAQEAQTSVGAPFSYVCWVLYRRYFATLFGRQLQDLQQRGAAQYALLANSEPGA